MSKAIIKAMEERLRQIDEEGFTAKHDDNNTDGKMAIAAAAYANHSVFQQNHPELVGHSQPANWPWHIAWWKPSPDPKRNIIKAMALLAAEYDRIERADAAATESPTAPELFSTDDEWQSDIYGDLQELIEDREREAGDVIYTGTKRPAQATDHTINLAESVIENMQVQAEDDAGEVGEGYPEVGKDEEQVLQALIDAWATTYCTPDFYTIGNVTEYIITAEDVEARQ
ncbi:hypothetical protein [Vreelandella olivaria]|uniref:hypothetical protein n=1 Tax=Vreelandella olivaria TaxID=390919 RepID=UPI00201E96C0|nr:hypothetical protein [Halomonas olivaria]